MQEIISRRGSIIIQSIMRVCVATPLIFANHITYYTHLLTPITSLESQEALNFKSKLLNTKNKLLIFSN